MSRVSPLIGGGLLIAALALTACASPSGSSSASCVGALVWRSVVYFPVPANLVPVGQKALEPKGHIPGCSDVNGGQSSRAALVNVVSIRDVSPEVAVAVVGRPVMLYLARGFPVEAKSHPLHDAIYSNEREPAHPPRDACSGRFDLVGKVSLQPGFGRRFEILQASGRRVSVELVASTTFRTRLRAGSAYVPLGLRTRVEGVRCDTPNVTSGFFATRVSAVAPSDGRR